MNFGALLKNLPIIRNALSRASRITALTLIILCALAIVCVKKLQAHVGDTVMRSSQEFMQYFGAKNTEKPQELIINSQKFFVATGSTQDSVEKVVDHFNERCSAAAILPREFDKSKLKADEKSFKPSISHKDRLRGYVACLHPGRRPRDLQSLAAQAKKFAASSDLGALGDVRYVYAQKNKTGTSYMTMWTEGSLNVKKLLGAEEDFESTELDSSIPRPPRSKRILSAKEASHTEQLSVFTTEIATIDALDKSYRPKLEAKGWQVKPLKERCEKNATCTRSLVIERDEVMHLLVMGRRGDNKTFLAAMNLKDGAAALLARKN